VTDGDAAGAPAGPQSPKERRLKLMLIASLAFNLLVVGAVAGAMIFGPHGPRHRGGSLGDEYTLMGFTRALSSDRRGPIRKAIREQRETFKPLREAVDEARRQAADVLVQEPFSKDKLKEAFDKINEADVKLKSAGQGMLLNTAESLTPDERRVLKDWWVKRHARWFRGRDDRRPPKDEASPDKRGGE
jgi:uncharacterized membrane protein